MKNKYINALSVALWDSDLIATRISLFFGELFWGVMLLWLGDTFSRPTYHVMSLVANEEIWGIIFLISAATQISIVMIEDMQDTLHVIMLCYGYS